MIRIMFDIDCNDTIVACATPPGEGGVAIVRISGREAVSFLETSFHPAGQGMNSPLESHRFTYGHLFSKNGGLIDEVMAVVMKAPRSFTREDVVEVQCHGGQILVKRIIAHFQELGARLAEPGEFTFRAFLNQRLDLTQAEAVIELIQARSDRARQLALQQLDGHLSQGIHTLQEETANLLSLVEAWIDFSEEELDRPSNEEFLTKADSILQKIKHLLSSYDSGRAYLEGISILLAGKPNVGKSSLMNTLLGTERAIVTEIEGTTRDFLEEGYNLDGLPLRLIDTAGLRDTVDLVESIGVRKTKDKMETADLILLVLDSSEPLNLNDRLAIEACGQGRILVVLNKCDKKNYDHQNDIGELPFVSISAKDGTGIGDLKEAIKEMYPLSSGQEGYESVVLTEQRQFEAAQKAQKAVQDFCDHISQDQPFEFIALDLRQALDALGEITGETTPDQILGRIFDRFCIGK